MAHLMIFKNYPNGSVTFGGSKGISVGKGTIRLWGEEISFDDEVLLKVPRQHNMYTFDMKNVDSSKGYTCLLAKPHLMKLNYGTEVMGGSKEVIDIDVQTEEAADLMVVSATKKTHSPPKQPSSTPISKSADDIMTFSKELDALALKHLGPVPATAPTSTNPVNTGSDNLNTVIEQDSTAGEDKGQREGKAPMLSEETPKKTKEQILKVQKLLKKEAGLKLCRRNYCSFKLNICWLEPNGAKVKGNTKELHILNAVKRIFKSTSGQTKLGIKVLSISWSKTYLLAMQETDYFSHSTTKAEYVAAANCCGQVLWVQNQLLTMVFNFMNTKFHIDTESTNCYCEESSLTRFAEIVDFLRGSNLRYALTANPTIYDSLVKQFWQSAVASTRADGSLEISTTVDTKSSKSSGWDQFGSNIATCLICLSNRDKPRPLLPSMLLVATQPPIADKELPAQCTNTTNTSHLTFPSPTPHYPTSTSPPPPLIPSPTPPPIPTPTSPPPPPPETEPPTDEHIYEEQSPVPITKHMRPKSHAYQMICFKQFPSLTDQRIKNLRFKGGKVKLTLKILQNKDWLHLLHQSNMRSGEEQRGRNKPKPLLKQSLPKTLSKVASLKSRSIDKGRRYKRRKESTGKKVVSSLDFQEDNTGAEKINTAGEINAASIEVNTASKVNTGSIELNTGFEQDSTAGENKGQREGKAPMLSEETPKKTKEQILQEEASLAEAIRLDSLQREEEAEQIHLDALLAQRIAEEEELTEQQKKRKAQVQLRKQLSKSMLGSELQGEDFAKKMVDLVNQRKKFFAEERAKAKRNKPMTQSQLKTYMMNYLKNQGSWKLNQLRKLSFEEVKEEFDKLIK
ncbi:hypothetical protein Tco_1344577 [Tanacetum coccineum]